MNEVGFNGPVVYIRPEMLFPGATQRDAQSAITFLVGLGWDAKRSDQRNELDDHDQAAFDNDLDRAIAVIVKSPISGYPKQEYTDYCDSNPW